MAAGLSGQQSEIAHPAEALGHQVPGEPPQEFPSRQRHVLLVASIPVVLPLEAHHAGFLIDPGDPRVADGDPACVARQIAHHRPRVAQRRAAEDVPVPARQPQPPVPARLHAGKTFRPLDPLSSFERFKHAQEDGPVDRRHVAHRKQVVGPGLLPAPCLEVPASGSDQHVQMRVPVQRAAPGMLHGQESARHAPVVLLEIGQRLRRGGEEHIRGDAVIGLRKAVELLRHGENDMEMRAIGQAPADLFRPLGLPRAQAHRAMPVPAGTGIPFVVEASSARRLVVAQFPVAAMRDEVERRILLFPESSGPQIAPFAQNVIDGRLDGDIVNTSAESRKHNFHHRFVDCFIHFMYFVQRQSPPTPARGRSFECRLRVESSWRTELAAGQVLGETSCYALRFLRLAR